MKRAIYTALIGLMLSFSTVGSVEADDAYGRRNSDTPAELALRLHQDALSLQRQAQAISGPRNSPAERAALTALAGFVAESGTFHLKMARNRINPRGLKVAFREVELAYRAMKEHADRWRTRASARQFINRIDTTVRALDFHFSHLIVDRPVGPSLLQLATRMASLADKMHGQAYADYRQANLLAHDKELYRGVDRLKEVEKDADKFMHAIRANDCEPETLLDLLKNIENSYDRAGKRIILYRPKTQAFYAEVGELMHQIKWELKDLRDGRPARGDRTVEFKK